MTDELEVAVHLEGVEGCPVSPAEVDAAVRLALDHHDVRAGELSVTLVGDEEIARLNLEYLGHPGPTDVISFPLSNQAGVTVGDVYVGLDQARRQADELGVPLREEVLRLALHGTLHVLGHDHPEEDREGSPMYVLQEELLRRAVQSGRGTP